MKQSKKLHTHAMKSKSRIKKPYYRYTIDQGSTVSIIGNFTGQKPPVHSSIMK